MREKLKEIMTVENLKQNEERIIKFQMSQEKENACKSEIRTLISWLCSELLRFSLFVHEEPLAHSAVFP